MLHIHNNNKGAIVNLIVYGRYVFFIVLYIMSIRVSQKLMKFESW